MWESQAEWLISCCVQPQSHGRWPRTADDIAPVAALADLSFALHEVSGSGTVLPLVAQGVRSAEQPATRGYTTVTPAPTPTVWTTWPDASVRLGTAKSASRSSKAIPVHGRPSAHTTRGHRTFTPCPVRSPLSRHLANSLKLTMLALSLAAEGKRG